MRGPITDLAATLLAAWASYGAGDAKAAVESIDKLQGADWYALFKDLHAGLILDLSGNKKEAGKRFDRAQKLDATALRLVEAYGSWLSRNGKKDEAIKVFKAFDAQLPRHPLIVDEMATSEKDKQLPPLVADAQAGAAEVLYGLGAALGRRGGEDLGLVYLQLALYLAPNQPLALLSLADLYEQVKNPQLAIKIYERVPQNSPLRRNAEIQLAVNLDTIDKTDEAKQRLQKLIKDHPDDIDAIMALGSILRGRKEFAECAQIYSKGVATIANPERPNWLIFYFRGICNERAKNWEKAEADLKQALKLYPDQPHVLNYLGYSWIDQGINLDDGMRMIRRAVEQRPDDGYIVDSLGWAYFRLGNYDEAVKNLERAVELKPDDPTINDHLGDAYCEDRAARSRRNSSGRTPATSSRSPRTSPRSSRSWRPAFPRRHRRRPMPARRSPTAAERKPIAWIGLPMPGLCAGHRRFGASNEAWTAGTSSAMTDRYFGMARLVEHAPAKVNLTLAVLGRRADGYHLLDSLVVFAGDGDRLTFAPGGPLSLDCARRDGRAGRPARRQSRAQGRARARGRNSRVSSSAASRSTSVCRWRRGSAADRPMPPPRCGCWLAPIASRSAIPRLHKVARRLGADVPVCVDPRPRRMRGIGEMLSAPLAMPKLAAVLVNPGVAVPTKDVFAMLGLKAGGGSSVWRQARALPRDRAGLIELLAERAQRSRARRDQASAGDRAGARGAARGARLPISRACRARARPALGCLPRRAPPPPPRAVFRPRIRAGG